MESLTRSGADTGTPDHNRHSTNHQNASSHDTVGQTPFETYRTRA